MYDQYRLQESRGVFSSSWKRDDGEYSWGQLEQLARQYPETKDVYDRATTRGTVLGVVGGAGGGIVGYTFGYNLTASEGDRWSRDQQTTMYAIGGGLILLGAVMGLAWPNPANEFASTYNCQLREQLGGRCKRSGKKGSHATPSFWSPAISQEGVAWEF